MTFKLSSKSKKQLIGVHPDLVDVVKRAIKLTPYDFGVSEGLRTEETQTEYYKTGKSTTMNSMHLPQQDGYSHAVDLFIFVNGKVSWEHKHFRKVVQAMMTAAIELGVQIEAGALWRDFLDSPHFELSRKYY